MLKSALNSLLLRETMTQGRLGNNWSLLIFIDWIHLLVIGCLVVLRWVLIRLTAHSLTLWMSRRGMKLFTLRVITPHLRWITVRNSMKSCLLAMFYRNCAAGALVYRCYHWYRDADCGWRLCHCNIRGWKERLEHSITGRGRFTDVKLCEAAELK